MEWVETTGRTVEEAKDAALDELGVDEQDAEFVVLEEPKTGLFGRLRSEARVRARVRPTSPRPKEDRRDRRRGRSGSRGERSDSRETTTADGGGQAAEVAVVADEETEQPAPASGRREPAGGGRRPAGKRPRRESGAERGTQVEQDVPLQEQAEVARTFLTGLLTELGAQASVDVRELDEDTVEVAVVGGELGTLIGPRGATLNALQDVTRTVVQRQTGARNGRLVVDVSGYRQKRREALERFVHEVAATAKETGERRVLEPMNPADRKVVHDTVNGIDGVRTVSEGEEPRRRVVIVPDEGAS
jgi:spoIIIJ-associated protein